MGYSPRIAPQMVTDIETTKPKVIWFNENYSIWGKNPKDYANDFLKNLQMHYVQLYAYRKGGKRYISTLGRTEKVDLEGRLYIRKEDVLEIIARLLSHNLVKESTTK